MIFNPTDKTKIVSQTFPHFTIDGHCLQFVNEFHYLGHNNLCDDANIKRKIHNMYVRTNMLIGPTEVQKLFTACKDCAI